MTTLQYLQHAEIGDAHQLALSCGPDFRTELNRLRRAGKVVEFKTRYHPPIKHDIHCAHGSYMSQRRNYQPAIPAVTYYRLVKDGAQ